MNIIGGVGGNCMEQQIYTKALTDEYNAIRTLMSDTKSGFCRVRLLDNCSAILEYVNDGLCELLGMTRTEVMKKYGNNPYMSVYADDLAAMKEATANMRSNGGRLSGTFRFYCANGSYIWVILFGRQSVTEDGRQYLNVYFTDVTEQYQKEQQSKELLNNLPCGAGLFELAGDEIKPVYINDRYKILVGRDVDSRMGKSAFDTVHPEDRESLLREVKQAIMQERDICCDTRILYGETEYHSYHIAGRVVGHEGDKFSIYVTYTLNSDDEISFREMMPFILSAVMESTTDLAFVKDKNFVYMCCSHAFAQMVGLESEAEVIGKTDYDLFSDRTFADKFREDDSKLLADGTSLIDMIEPIPSIDGVPQYSSTSKYLLYDRGGNIIGIYGVGRNVTEYQSAFEQLKLLTDNIPGGLAMFKATEDGVYAQYLSDNIYDLVGNPKNENEPISEKNIMTLVFLEDLPMVNKQIEALRQNSRSIDITYRLHTADGGYKWLNLRGVPLRRQGDAIIINAVIFDVTEKKISDEANRIHDEEMRVAMSQMGKMICEYDPVTCELILPEVYANWYGVPSKLTNIPNSVHELNILGEDYRDAYIEFYEAIRRGEKKGALDLHIQRKDKSWSWEHHEFVTIFGDNKKPIKAVLSVEDTTEQQETKQQYEHELQLRHELVKDSVIYYELNLSTGIIEGYLSQLSDVASMASAVHISERIRTDILENVVEEDHDLVRNTIFSSALLKAYRQGKMSVSVDYRRIFPDKKVHWVRSTATITKKPYSDEVLAFIFIRDIDVEKKDQMALDNLMKEEIEAVCILRLSDRKLRYVKINGDNDHKTKMFMYEEHIAHFIQKKVAEADKGAVKAFLELTQLQDSLLRKATATFTYKTTEMKGQVFRKRILASYLNDAREEIVFSVRDITNLYEEEQHKQVILREAAEAANKANLAKSIFLSRMSHDMRTPLNAILTMSGRDMLDEATAKQKDEYLEKIHMSGEYLLGIINDVLDMSRIESGKTVLEPAPYYVPGFQDMIETVIGETCRKKNIRFNYHVKGHKSDWVMLDKVRFEQIFINLLSNAVKFTPSGGTIDFIIDTIKYDGINIEKRFIIKDSGIGMSETFLPHAFDSFAQESRRDVSENNMGTGLGLAIVKKTVDLMGGRISVESEIGKGTTFTVDLSYKTTDKPSEAAPDEVDLERLSGRRILLCEDNEINAEIIITLLKKKGMEVVCAENGATGLQMFQKFPPGHFDLILMDRRMPIMDGIEAAKAIRALKRKDAAQIPIIALTADAFAEDEQLSFDAGMNGHLPKPIVPNYLYEMLASYIH